MGLVGNWVIGQSLALAKDVVVKTFFSETLESALLSEVDAWSRSLPASIEIHLAKALFPDIQANVQSVGERPAALAISQKVQLGQLPSQADWETALTAQWQWVRDNISEPQPFFLAEADVVAPHIQELARRIDVACQRDWPLFQSAVIELLRRSVASITHLENQSTEILAVVRGISLIVESNSQVSDGKFHEQIDAAAKLNQKHPDLAIEALEKLRKHHWTELSSREKFRVLANLGHAHDGKGDLQSAARYFIEAKAHQPDDEQACALEAVAHYQIGDDRTARSLANEILTRFPSSQLATAIIVRTSPTAVSIDDVAQQISGPLKTSVEVSSALAWLAARRGNFSKAEEFGRTALKQQPDSWQLQEELATVLLAACRDEAAVQYTETPRYSNESLLAEARGLLKSAEKGAGPTARARIRYQLGTLDHLCGNAPSALHNFQEAYEGDPANDEYARKYAFTLYENDQIDDAIAIAKLRASTSPNVALLYGFLLLERQKGTDVNDAITVLESILPRIAEIESPTHLQVLSTLARGYLSDNRPNDAIAMVDGLNVPNCPAAVRNAIKSDIFRAQHDLASAQTWAKAASSELAQVSDFHIRRWVASSLALAALDAEAFEVLKTLVTPKYASGDTHQLLLCANRIGEDEFIITFCEQLRANGVIDEELVHGELNKLQEYHCINDAIALLKMLLSERTENDLFRRELQARLSHLLILIGKGKDANVDIASLPQYDEVEPQLGLVVAQVLQESGRWLESQRYAYELVRHHFDSPWSHKALVLMLLRQPETSDEPVSQLDTVSVGTAVTFRDEASGDISTIVIEDGKDPNIERNEYPPQHSLAQALLGKRVGDTFTMHDRPLQERTAQILEVRDKIVFRYLDCLDEWENRFPDVPFLWKFTSPKKPDGTYDLSLIYKSVDDRIQRAKFIERIYRNNPFSVTTFSKLAGITPLESLHHLSQNRELPIRCCEGAQATWSAGERAAGLTKCLLLDATALATIFVTDSLDRLLALPFKLKVTEGTLLPLRLYLLERLNAPDSGVVTKRDNRYGLVERSEADTRYLESLQTFVNRVQEKFIVVGGRALARMSLEERTELIGILDHASAETIAEACVSNDTLYSDDLIVSVFAQQQFHLRRVWSQSLFTWARDRGYVTDGFVNELIGILIARGYSHTFLTIGELLALAQASKWDPSDKALAGTLAWFSDPNTEQDPLVDFSSRVLAGMTKHGPMLIATRPISFAVLDHLSQRIDGEQIVRLIQERVHIATGVDEITRERLLRDIEIWKSTHRPA